MSYDKTQPSEYDGLFQKAADTHGVSYDLLRKVAYNESRFDPNAKSKTGPLGIMQFTKATAKAMGLKVTGGADDARLNPELAIDAAGRHLSDLVRKFNGDELKAALAYNQGEGPKGSAQLEAYDKGDWSSISTEGLNYMRNLTDVSRSDRKGDLEAFGGITPKAKGIPSEVAFKGITPKGKVGTELPESTGFTIKGKEQEAPAKSFAQDFWEHYGTTPEEFEDRSTFFGFTKAAAAELHNSVGGVAFSAARYDNTFDVIKDALTPTKWNSYVPTKEDLQKLRDSGIPPSYYHVVTGGDAETWDELIDIAKRNYEYDRKAADAGTGAKLSAGILGAGVDPLTWVPGLGAAGKGIKVVNKAFVVGAEAAATNVASEWLRTSVAGGEAHYTNAALSGMLFGAGMSAISDGLHSLRKVDNPYAGPALRLEARESALNAGGEDLTKVTTENLTFDKEYNGVQFADHPVEEGATVLPTGIVLSASNPANPKNVKTFHEVDPERAAFGIKSAGFTELGLTLLRSTSKEVRGIAQDLVRSPTGMESGSHGKFGATASDIHERLQANDQRSYRQIYDALYIAEKDPEFNIGPAKLSKEGVRQELFKRAALAIERPELQSNLTKGERDLMNLIKKHFDVKREMMENPAMFGNTKAVSIFPGSRHKGTYVPNVYDRAAKVAMIERYGAEGLQEAIAQSWLTSYHSRPEVKTRVDEYLAEANGVQEVTPEMVQKHAMDKAYGISHTSNFQTSSVIEENLKDGVGIENNEFLEARNMFDSDMRVTLSDGETFAVNDLRTFDMNKLIPAYDRRINGDIAIMGSTGKTTKELKDSVQELKNKATATSDGALGQEVAALWDTMKILTGRARREPASPWEVASQVLTDMSFFSKNAYMGVQNFTEIGGLLARGKADILLNTIPVLRDWATRKGAMSAKEATEIHGVLFGKEIDDLIRPSREDIVQRMRENSGISAKLANVIGTVKYGSQELAARSPLTRILNETSNVILNTARQGVILDIANHSFKGSKTTFGKENYLKGASITPEQWNGVKKLFKDHAELGSDGKFTIKDKEAFAMDPRAMDLWRIADKFADETILRPHKVSYQDTKAYSPGIRLAMQFKNFTIKSLNGRFMRSFYTATKNNRAVDQAISAVLSGGLALGFYIASTYAKSLGLPKEQADAYRKKALTKEMYAMAIATRSSHLGAPGAALSSLAGLAGWDPASYVRTAVLPKEPIEREKGPSRSRDLVAAFGGNVAQQMPAIGYAASIANIGLNAIDYANATTRPDEMDVMTSMMNTTRELLPNDPVTQQLILNFYTEQGIVDKKKF